MKKITINRRILAKNAANIVGISQRESIELVDMFFQILIDGLCNDECVKISRFGCFLVKKKMSRVGRNLRTGEKIIIPARKHVILRYSTILRKKM